MRGIEHHMIRIMCGVRLVYRVLTDILHDRVGVVKIKDSIIQSRLRWCGHIMYGDIQSKIRKVMEVEITLKRKQGRLRKSLKECVKKALEQYRG